MVRGLQVRFQSTKNTLSIHTPETFFLYVCSSRTEPVTTERFPSARPSTSIAPSERESPERRFPGQRGDGDGCGRAHADGRRGARRFPGQRRDGDGCAAHTPRAAAVPIASLVSVATETTAAAHTPMAAAVPILSRNVSAPSRRQRREARLEEDGQGGSVEERNG
jgi:hypothetical protein